MARLTPIQKIFLEMTPIGVWLSPNPKGYKKHGVTKKTIHSLKRKGYIETAREFGGQFDPWAFRVKRIK